MVRKTLNNYVVTYYWQEDINNEASIKVRGLLEEISPKRWIQIFPNQVTIQSELSIKELRSKLENIPFKMRISIFSFDQFDVFPEERFNDALLEFGYNLKDKK